MEPNKQNPLLATPPFIDMNDPQVRAGMLGLPVPGAQPKAPSINPSPEAPKTNIANVPPTVEAKPASTSGGAVTASPIIAAPTGAAKIATGLEHELEVEKFKQQHPWGSKASNEIDPTTGQPFAGNHDTGLGRFLHGVAKVGNIAGNIVAPGITAAIPGSDLNRRATIARDTKNVLPFEKEASEEPLRAAEANKANNPNQSGKTPEEQFMNDALHGGPNGGPKMDKQGKPYNYLSAHGDWKQTEQDVKPDDENKQPVGDVGVTQHTQQLNTLMSGMSDKEKQDFNTAYAVRPTDTHAIATKRLEDAKAAAGLSGGERDRALQRDIAKQNHQDSVNHQNETMGLESVQYRDKDGHLLTGSYQDAKAGGGTGIRKISPEDQQKARQNLTQFDRWIGNAQAAEDSMAAWDNPQDKELSVRIMHKFFEDASAHIGAFGTSAGGAIDPDYLNAMQNLNDYKSLSPVAQEHMQNMFTVWSDAINLMKSETGGVPRGEHFLKLESAILPQPEKTQEQNYKSLRQFEQRIKKDSMEYARPNDMRGLGGVVPHDATHRLKDQQGNVIGYTDGKGKDNYF